MTEKTLEEIMKEYEDENKKEGPYNQFYENGKLKIEGNYKNDKKDGMWKTFYENGQIKREENYENGVNEVVFKSYRENGQVYQEGKYINNHEEGLWKTFYENGQLSIEGSYENGKKSGLWKHWYNSGQLWFEGKYINHYEEGLWKAFYENGQLEEEGKYENGVKEGLWKKYTSEGKLDYSVKYKNGEDEVMIKNEIENESIIKDLKTQTKKTNNLDVIITSLYGYLSGFGDNKVIVNMSRENIRKVLREYVNEDEFSTDKKLEQYLDKNDYMIDPLGGWFEVFDQFTNIETLCVNRTRIRTKYLENYEDDYTYLEMRELETINYGMSYEEKTKNPELQTKLDKDLNHDYFLKVKQTKSGDFEVIKIEDEEEIKKLQKLFDDMIERGGILDTGRDFYHIDKFNLKEELKSY